LKREGESYPKCLDAVSRPSAKALSYSLREDTASSSGKNECATKQASGVEEARGCPLKVCGFGTVLDLRRQSDLIIST
jgi:hypothetical protein